MKSFIAILLLALGFSGEARAAVTLVFSQPFVGKIASNFANFGGVATNGMRWGVIVDTSNNGFSNSGLSYDAYAAGVTTNGFFGNAGAATDDYFIAGGLTADSSLTSEVDTGIAGAAGTIFNTSSIPLTASGGVVNTGQKFALVWFSTNTSDAGDHYGFFTDVSFVLPSDGSTTPFDGLFAGADPIRSASNTFAAVAGVPEPSRMLLVGFGALGLMFRRRRSVA